MFHGLQRYDWCVKSASEAMRQTLGNNGSPFRPKSFFSVNTLPNWLTLTAEDTVNSEVDRFSITAFFPHVHHISLSVITILNFILFFKEQDIFKCV